MLTLLHPDVPGILMQAPIGGSVSPELVRAVSGAGGLGCFACRDPEVLAVEIPLVRGQYGDVPFGVNFVLSRLTPEHVDLIVDLGVLVVPWSWGVKPDLQAKLRGAGVRTSAQIGSLEQARAAEATGVDVLVVQGVEAGGGLQGTRPLAELLAQVLSSTSLPVLGAGGSALPLMSPA